MNIDIKNSLDRLMAACESIEHSAADDSDLKSIKNIVAGDIFEFIRGISIAGTDSRIQSFNRFYLGGNYTGNESSAEFDTVPRSLELLLNIDNTVLKNAGFKTASLFTSLMMELGRYYISSKFDKEDIDPDKVTKYLEVLSRSMPKAKEHDKSSAVADSVLKAKETLTDNASDHADKSESVNEDIVPEKSLDELMQDLNNLIGLYGVKKEVNSLINMLKINRLKEENGIKAVDVSKHLVFLGNPGTGKTTVARLLSKIYKEMGVLETGQLVETDREGLVAGYVGQSEEKTKKKINEAMGGILFIDEAYTLAKGKDDFGQVAIDILLKEMEDHRDKFVVIVAGYPGPMENFLESNPGLRSRFNKYIEFEDYTEEELLAIFKSKGGKRDLHLNNEAEEYLENYLNNLCNNKPENFANGREMRNLFEKAIQKQADRLAKESSISAEMLTEIRKEDLIIQ